MDDTIVNEDTPDMGTETIDVLNRQEYIDRILKIIEVLSGRQRNLCFAINGKWGVGKTFVLDMLEKQLEAIGQESTNLSRYLVFRYNCWEYDYYEEPLIAIVASILDQFDEKVNLISADKKEIIKQTLKTVGLSLVKASFKLALPYMNSPLAAFAGEFADELKKEENSSFDQYVGFKKKLKELQKSLEALAEDQTVIIIVDELDRCLPEYTIKVLERLHHLFEGVSNTQVVLSIDRGQLEHVVKNIYGEQTDTHKYLEKFIQFELYLDEGDINDQFEIRFESYISKFSKTENQNDDIGNFIRNLLCGIDMRKRISLIEKCELYHSLLEKDGLQDRDYLCMELFLALLNTCEIDVNLLHEQFNLRTLFKGKLFENANGKSFVPTGLSILGEHYKDNKVVNGYNYYGSDSAGTYIYVGNLYGKILAVYRKIIGFDDIWLNDNRNMIELVEHGTRFWKLLETIK